MQENDIAGGDDIRVIGRGFCKLDLRDELLLDQRGRVGNLCFHPNCEDRRNCDNSECP